MNPDEFEKRLSSTPSAGASPEWRAQILDAARGGAVAEETGSLTYPAWLRLAWGTLGLAWALILILFSTGPEASAPAGSVPDHVSWNLSQRLVAYDQLRTELAESNRL